MLVLSIGGFFVAMALVVLTSDILIIIVTHDVVLLSAKWRSLLSLEVQGLKLVSAGTHREHTRELAKLIGIARLSPIA